jgi:hypothetical protein
MASNVCLPAPKHQCVGSRVVWLVEKHKGPSLRKLESEKRCRRFCLANFKRPREEADSKRTSRFSIEQLKLNFGKGKRLVV